MGKIFAPDFSGHQTTSKSGITEATRLLADKADNFYGRLEDHFLLFEGSDLECRDDAQGAVELSPWTTVSRCEPTRRAAVFALAPSSLPKILPIRSM